jgi:excisionase family DNA binding protein
MRTQIANGTPSLHSIVPEMVHLKQGADMSAHEIVATATRLLGDTGEAATPWIGVNEAARRARCGVKLLYREIRAGRLQAARVGGRRELRLRAEWIDAWLSAQTIVR